MTSAEELIRILEGDENEEFLSDEDLNLDEEVIILLHRYYLLLYSR